MGGAGMCGCAGCKQLGWKGGKGKQQCCTRRCKKQATAAHQAPPRREHALKKLSAASPPARPFQSLHEHCFPGRRQSQPRECHAPACGSGNSRALGGWGSGWHQVETATERHQRTMAVSQQRSKQQVQHLGAAHRHGYCRGTRRSYAAVVDSATLPLTGHRSH